MQVNGSNRGACFAWSRGELRAIVMFDGNDDAKCANRRVAVPVGSVRRRRWSAAEKASVVKETLAPGARVSDVARRWQVDPQQVYRWRHNEGVTHRRTMRRSHAAEPAFVPIVTESCGAPHRAPLACLRFWFGSRSMAYAAGGAVGC